ncbi:MAG: hypothetical protein AUG51_10120 [Acidobacteria bacterium 13_1_20CM_3_53_8]|nr:MAG: hypothetical protein AUG51_10120 [Acidobacteria bacterium 13_1_20CM_3_53_8]
MSDQETKSFRIYGSVIDRKTRRGVAGLRIEAWDKDPIFDDLVGSSMTDARGNFHIEFNEDYFKEFFLDRKPDLFFKILRGGELMGSTEDDVLWNVENGDERVEIAIELPAIIEPSGDGEPKMSRVRGQIRHSDGRPLKGLTVRAFNKKLRDEERLGEAVTNEEGRYDVSYNLAPNAENLRVNLFIRVYDREDEVMAASGIIFKAGADETIDITLDEALAQGPSEYEELLERLKKDARNVAVNELTENDIRFLHEETGANALHLAFLVLAARLASRTKLPAAIFYGLFRQNLPTRLEGLLLETSERLRAALDASLKQNLIPASFGAHMDEILRSFDELQNLRPDGEQPGAPVFSLLKTTTLSPQMQTKFIQLSLENEGAIEDFWESLRRSADFGEDRVRELQLTFQLGSLTQNHAPLVRELQLERPLNSIQSLRDLAGMEETDWLGLIKRAGVPDQIAGASIEEKSRNYAQGIAELMAAAFPTATFAAKLQREKRAEDRDVLRFFSNQPEFDFDGTRIDDYLDSHAQTALAGVRDRAELQSQLKSMQRVFRIAPGYEHARALLDEGLSSAYALVTLSETAFVERFKTKLNGEVQARSYYARAQHLSETSASIFANVSQAVHDITPKVIAAVPDDVKKMPNFQTLFGESTLCECKDCRSVYSPAAYFVDLLQFLNPAVGPKPINSLRKRRPDLMNIRLSCENTNTTLPYLDLVNEVLEFYVAHGHLSATLAKDILGASAEELSANPQYTNDAAYAKLTQAVYPPSMPFHQPLEVARLYLKHLGSSRYEMMKSFQRAGQPTDLEISSEHLRLSNFERDLITNATPTPLRVFYGYSIAVQMSDKKLVQELSAVPQFLQRTGLTYAEMIELLGTEFISAGTKMEPVEQGAEPHCDVQQMTIQPFNIEALKKIHRFIRLWRKLGWTMRDVDQAIRAFQATDLTPDFLEQLSLVNQLQTELHLPVDQLLSLWTNIETEGENPLYDRLFQNKAVSRPTDADFKSFELNDARTELKAAEAQTPATISENIPAILAALRVNSTDMDLIRAATNLADQSAPLNLANLSKLYRYAVLASALKLRIKEFLSLQTLTGRDPFQAGDIASTLEFVIEARRVKRSSFTLAQLDYLYRHVFEPTSNLAPQAAHIALLLAQLQDGLRKTIDENADAFDPTGELLRSKLGTVLDASLLDSAMSLIDGSPSMPNPDQFIELNFNTFLSAEEITEAKDVLLGSSNLGQEERKQANRAYVLAHLLSFMRDSLSRSFIKQTLSDDLKLEATVADVLLETILKAQTENQSFAIADFMALVGDGLSATYFQNTDLTGAQATRVDPEINFNWGAQEIPAPQIAPVAYSINWTGKLLAPFDEDYTFFVRVKDGVRLRVDNQLIIDQWQAQTNVVEHSATIKLVPGRLYDISLDFFKQSGDATIELRWSSPSTPKQTVPQSQLYSGLLFTSFDKPLLAYKRLHKSALVINGFKIKAEELGYLSAHPQDFAGFDLNELPLDTSGFTVALFRQWERLSDLFMLRDSLPQAEAGLMDVFGAASLDEAVSLLKKATAWNTDELDFLVGTDGFALAASDLKNETMLLRLQSCLKLNARLGVSCERLFEWASSVPDAEQAREIVNTAKAKYTAEQWLGVAKPLNDVMRESQRTALVAYLLASKEMAAEQITESNQLFEFFLIDVDMSACMKTSRIVQAVSSVQLFIQRCLMNLEPDVDPVAIDEEQWKWMKNYRVWEANRKVFLYPENWIEPELRDDKSPIFEELENQLLQSDVTDESAEGAFLSYLEKLDRIARLEVCGIYSQYETLDNETTDILHVFGRTFDTPHIYYYRQLIDGKSWTPWEKIDLDIDSDHLVPVVYNRRLYLFWPTFAEKADANQELSAPYVQSMEHFRWSMEHKEWEKEHADWQQKHNEWAAVKAVRDALDSFNQQQAAQDDGVQVPLPDPGPEPQEPREPEEPQYTTKPALTHWEIQLAWSERKQNKWIAKQTSKDAVISPFVKKNSKEVVDDLGGYDNKASLDTAIKNLGLGTEDTVAAIYLPQKEEHFFRTRMDSGKLVIEVYRRYRHVFRPFNIFDSTIKGYQYVGSFYPDCGSRVYVISDLKSRPLDSLARPEETTNSYMMLAHDTSPKDLVFTTKGKSHEILRSVPDVSMPFNLLDEHKFKSFVMTSPYQRFFYQDKHRTYFVNPTSEQPFQNLTSLNSVAPDLSYLADDALASVFKEKMQVPARGVTTSTIARVGSAGGVRPSATRRSDSGQTMAAMTEISNPMMALAMGDVNANAYKWTNASSSTFVALDEALMQSSPLQMIAATLTFYLKFESFFHPHVCAFINALNSKGVEGLLKRGTQQLDNDRKVHERLPQYKTVFEALYKPSSYVNLDYPRENVQFDGEAYSIYNWELFFHVPMLVATQLSGNQQFEDAQKWFHYIFNPTTSSKQPSPRRYWNTLPFFNNSHPENDQIQALLYALDDSSATPTAKQNVENQIEQWRQNPFNPHLIARMRITAYQKNVVMKYIDNLLSWGDQLFSQDTMETINEATMLYVLAANILGARPETIPPRGHVEPKTYDELLASHLDKFSNALVELENEPLFNSSKLIQHTKHKDGKGAQIVKSVAQTFYFCIPRNDYLLKYWDTVADRLFKIRHCMNIEGVVRELPLFAPPIDPALLVRATAMGLDLSSVLSDINSPLPNYRFGYTLQRAQELSNELKALGSALLSALEKKDGEALTALRSSHEINILNATREVKQKQLDEAKQALEALKKSQEVIETRRAYYRDIVRISDKEQLYMDDLNAAHVLSEVAQGLSAGVSVAHMLPDFHTGAAGWSSPFAVAKWGGSNLGNAMQAAAGVVSMVAAQHTHDATMASVTGGYDRRWNEWKQQEKLASKELEQIEKQITGAEIRAAIAENELNNHDLQIENSRAVEQFLRDKYTNQELYNWMLSQISAVFFQSYKLAYDMAKRAEKTYRFERGLTASNFIQFGYWDSLRKGLLAGERLSLDLKRLEMAYLDQNKREYEISKQISLQMLDPINLIMLKETGQCEIALPESLFDADYPGHYMRRLKSVTLTIPCVAGPYTGVNCTLTLLRNKIRIDGNARQAYMEDAEAEDARFVTNFGAVQSIATSHARNDGGMFELNFRDERYLPFEGAGVISTWRIELPKDCNAFDFETISDVIITLNYTAREGGELLRAAARAAVLAGPHTNLLRLFSARHEFPFEWHGFLSGTNASGIQSMLIDLTQPERFPFRFKGKSIKLNTAHLYLKLKDEFEFDINLQQQLRFDLRREGGNSFTAKDFEIAGTPFENQPTPHTIAYAMPFQNHQENTGRWFIDIHENDLAAAAPFLSQTVSINGQNHLRLNADAIEDIYVIFEYSV